MIAFLLIFALIQHSNLLKENELRLLNKGVTFVVFKEDISYRLSYDIWQNTYNFYNEEESLRFSTVDEGLLAIRKKHQLKSLFVMEKVTKRSKRQILLFDTVNKFLKERKFRREIVFEEN
jgi:hypothetical protein